MKEGLTLVIDHDRRCNRDLAAALRAGGHSVLSAHSIAEALHAISRFRPAAAVLDLNLGEMSGLALIPLLRLANAACRIVVRSAYYGAAEDRNAAELGADVIVAKSEDETTVLAGLRFEGNR
jgi:ActR/RegA family two-component response regulator